MLRSVKKEGKEMLQALQQTSLQPMVSCPLQPVEIHSGIGIHFTVHEKHHTGADGFALKEDVTM